MKQKATRDGPLKVPQNFDNAIRLALVVKPPAEGWAAYERRLKAEKRIRPKMKPKPSA